MRQVDLLAHLSMVGMPEINTPGCLLKHGLHCARQGHFSEAISFFVQASSQLGHEHQLASYKSLIEAFLIRHAAYLQAQQNLQQASKCFVEAEQAQQESLLALETIQPFLEEHYLSPPTLSRTEIIDEGMDKPTDHVSNSPQGVASSQSPILAPLLVPASTSQDKGLPPLFFTCFGRFEVRSNARIIAPCPNRNGQTILRYLVAHPKHRETADVLMNLLWPEDESRVANHKLQVAISALRCSLNSGYALDKRNGYILYTDHAYYLNHAVQFNSDVNDFLELYQAGQRAEGNSRLASYERACHLYTGPFLPEDVYADWSFHQRERLLHVYLVMCHALADAAFQRRDYQTAERWSRAILQEDRCDEIAHRQLMQVCAATGRRSEALRHYQHCQRVLLEELGMQPSAETMQTFQAIASNDANLFQ